MADEQPLPVPTVHADLAGSDENDSAYGDDEIQSYTTSLSSSVERYVWQNGRRFHSYREGAYNFPNDAPEQDRLDLNHQLCLMLLDDKLHLAPIDGEQPLRILDVGTGTGIWAMDMGDKYPNIQVLGNDLSPIQPRWVPPNVQFEVDDCESPWPYRTPFHYVHIRYMLGSILDWPALIRQAYHQITPGGFIELQDFATEGYSEDGTAGPDNMFTKFCEVFNAACNKIGRNGSPGRHLKGWVEDAGFVNVEHRVFKVPVGPWAKDKHLKRIGAVHHVVMSDVLEAALIGLLTRVEGWQPEEVQVFIAQVRKDMRKKSVHIMQEFHVVWAQKPELPVPTQSSS